MDPTKVFCESRIDFKYHSIFSRLPSVETIEGKYPKLLYKLLRNQNSIYHIRYLKYRGVLFTPIRIMVVLMICKLSKSKIIWSCHNIYEHNIGSRKYNNWLRLFVASVAEKIIVFHEDLLDFFPKKIRSKISVACFGDMKTYIKNQNESNEEFKERYAKWLKGFQVLGPHIISISAAKRNKLDFLIKGVHNTRINTLIIAPNHSPVLEKSKNVLFYTKFVKSEVGEILENPSGIVGFIGHDNISVPTSIYMYASYGIPMIVLDQPPINTLIRNYKIGLVAKDPSSIDSCYRKIHENYNFYKDNCFHFLAENSWDRSARVHSKVFL